MYGAWTTGGTWKNCWSPCGEAYFAPATYRHLKDCPLCIHGTIGERGVCCDCGRDCDEYFYRIKRKLEDEEYRKQQAIKEAEESEKCRKQEALRLKRWEKAKAKAIQALNPEMGVKKIPDPFTKWGPPTGRIFVRIANKGDGFIVTQDEETVTVQLIETGELVWLPKAMRVEKL